jgi:hypothetical protein
MMSEQPAGVGRKSYVYAIGDADHRQVKIGYTNNPRRRLTNIQITCPFAVSILWQIEGDATLEDALHWHFKSYHLRGEWFEFPAGQNAVDLIGQAAEAIRRAEDAEHAEVADRDAGALPGGLGRIETQNWRLPPDSMFRVWSPVPIACTWMATARRTLGLDHAGMAALIYDALDWDVMPETVAVWEDDIAPPWDVLLASTTAAQTTAPRRPAFAAVRWYLRL